MEMQQAHQQSAVVPGQGSSQRLDNNTSQQANLPLQQNTENKCIRVGCNKPAVVSEEWQQEYCSQECVVLHCNNIFSAWVASNLQNKSTDILHSVKT